MPKLIQLPGYKTIIHNYGGNYINKKCPQCNNFLMTNIIGETWCNKCFYGLKLCEKL